MTDFQFDAIYDRLERIACALERIADSLEPTKPQKSKNAGFVPSRKGV